jgi:Eukaryotic aspartyl protease
MNSSLLSLFGVILCKISDLTTIAVTNNVIPLIARRGDPLSRRYIRAYHTQHSKRSISNTSPILWAANGNVYLTPVKFGKQSFLSVLDTGSADTWLVGRNFSCLEVLSRKPQAQKECRFGPSFNTSASPTFKQLGDQHFNISYADGEFLNGIMGIEEVSLAGITVPKQTVGVVDYAAWMGDTKSSGLVGLAYPSVTRAYPGNNTRMDRRGGNIPYSPIFTTMWKNNLTAPLFSLALARNKNEDGVLAFGGLPGHPVRYSTTFARTPIEYTTITSTTTVNGTTTSFNQTEYQMYTISVENFSFAKQISRFQLNPSPEKILIQKPEGKLIIDSGTTLMFLTAALAASINAQFTPASRYDEKTQTYFVGCNATAPRVGLTIGGTTFWLDPKDMVQSDGPGANCISGVQAGGEGTMIVGDVFLKSVLAVFDVGAGEMRFAVRY